MTTPKTTTMNDGDVDNPPRRGRSKETRNRRLGRSLSRGDERSRERRERGEKAGAEMQIRQSRSRSTKQSRSRSRDATNTNRRARERVTNGREEDNAGDDEEEDNHVLSGEVGRAVKQEIIDNVKVQQTIAFPVRKTQPTKGSSAKEAWVIDDDDDATLDTHTSESTATPKRKQIEMMKGISRESSTAAKRPAITRGGHGKHDNGGRMGTIGGRGRGMGRGRGIGSERGPGGVGVEEEKSGIERITQGDKRGTEGKQMYRMQEGYGKRDETSKRIGETGGRGSGMGRGGGGIGCEMKETGIEEKRGGRETNTREEEKSTGGKESDQTVEMKNHTREEEEKSTDEVIERMSNMGVEGDKEKDKGTPVKRGGRSETEEQDKERREIQTEKESTRNEKETTANRNPYRKKEPVTYAMAAQNPQTKIKTHQKVKEAYDAFYEVTFQADELSSNPSMLEIVAVLKAQIKSILMRAKEVDRKAKINAWADSSDLPTIVKSADVPESPAKLQEYLAPPRRGKMVEKGRNSNWKIRITTHISREEFIHHWGLSKREYTRTQYIPLRSAPLQAPTYYAAGYFLNSSDGQITETLEREFEETLGHRVGISYKPAALHKRAADEFWKKAKKARDQAPDYEKARTYFKNAPMVMQVYTETREQAKTTAYKLNELYGSTDQDGMYPRMPDGTRMRFVAAHVYVDMIGRATAATLFKQQMLFQQCEVTAPIPIRDPHQRFTTQNNKTMHELVMDLQDSESNNEPYFRNMKKKFHWNYKTKEWEVQIHSIMYPRAAKILRRFKEHMTEQYGIEVGDAIMNGVEEDIPQEFGSQSATTTGISIATDDRYLNGEAKFLIIGMEKVQANQTEETRTLGDIRRGEDDENTINIRSTTSGMTGNSGYTVPSTQGMEETTQGDATMEERETGKEERERERHDKYTTIGDQMMREDEDYDKTNTEPWRTVTRGKGSRYRHITTTETRLDTHLSGPTGGGIT